METEGITRQLKVYCPMHQTIFEVEEKPQIICEIKEHALANDFPNSEYWEFCADCQTFSPSSFGTGGKAKDACRHCERTTVRRFLCDECKIVSFESDEDTKGKFFTIGAEGMKPNCPGCRKVFGEISANQHQCTDIENSLMTHRAECPFCQKLTFEKASSPQQVEPLSDVNKTAELPNNAGSTQCPNCGHWGFAGRIHCGKCGNRLSELAEGVLPGTSAPRTQLLGSICPNCGTGNQAGSSFCNNCGQALKVIPLSQAGIYSPTPNFPYQTGNLNPPPPNIPPPPPIPNAQTNIPIGAQTLSPDAFQQQNYSDGSKKPFLIVFSGLLFVVFIVGIIAYNANKGNSVLVTTTSPSPTSTKTTDSKSSTPRPASTTENTSSANVGSKGRLTTNVNIRVAPNKTAESRGIHYENARIEVLAEESYNTNDGEYVTWYKVRVLENGCDRVGNNGCGNNWERNGSLGWLEAEMVGWMNSKHIILD